MSTGQDQLTIQLSELRQIAARRGLTVLSITNAEILNNDRDRLKIWQESGFAGEMKYMARSPELLSDPRALLPVAKSIISFAVPYSRDKSGQSPKGYGRIARYAWGKDYHLVIKDKLIQIAEDLRAKLGEKFKSRCFTDAVPLLERALAVKSGIGFIGKNTLNIIPGEGSFHFLAEILLNVEVVDRDLLKIAREGKCGSCQSCISSCPTKAITEPYKIDARKCISYLTIEKDGLFDEWEAESLGDWLFGCDICQEVCPFNHAPMSKDKELIEEFLPKNGAGEFLSINEILSISSDEAFNERFKDSPLSRAGREGLIRNAAAVAANTRYSECLSSLEVLASNDKSEIVRESARRAMTRLSAPQ